jgi:WD40 repeat protein
MEIKRKNKKEKFELYLMIACCIVLTMSEIARAAKPVKETATYTVTFSGDLVGSFERENMPVYEDRIEHMPVKEPRDLYALDLHDFFVQKIGQAEADICFPYHSKGLHGINPIQKHPERGAIISLFFDGFDHNGDALMYRLDLTGHFADLSNWTPEAGTTSDVILTNWEVQSDTKGGRNKACRAEGELDATVTVYREPTTTSTIETLELDPNLEINNDKAEDYSWMQQVPMRLGEGQVASIAFSPDGTILYAAHRTDSSGYFWDAQTVIYWDPQTREQVGALPHHLVSAMALSPDGNILVTSAEPSKTIYLWDVAGKSQMGQIQVPSYHNHFTFSPDGKILASAGNGQLDDMVRLWDVQTQKQIATISRDEGNGLLRGNNLAFSVDGRLLVVGGSRNGTHDITLWDVQTQKQVGELFGHLDATDDLAFNPNGTILASAGGWEDKAVYLWYVQTQELIGVLGGNSAHVDSIDFSPDGKLLASTSKWEDSVYVWDVEGQVLIGKLNGHDATDSGWHDQVDISSDGKWLACGSENGVELWEANLSGAVPQTSAYGPLPRDGAIHDATWVTLSWLPGIHADSHDVYMGNNFDEVNEGIDEVYYGNQTDTYLFVGFPGFPYPGGLVPGTTYYWRIDEVNDSDPNSPWQGPVWSLTIPPYEASNPVPADGADPVELDVVLSWEAGVGAIVHTMYFGEDFDNVANATEGLSLTQTTYAPGTLEQNKTYCWQIDEFDGFETHKGDVWSFTTLVVGDN